MDTATGLSLLSNNPKLPSLLESQALIAKPLRHPGCFTGGTGKPKSPRIRWAEEGRRE